MCRWAAYSGSPIFLEEVVSAPGQSLIAQSRHAREAKTETNGDGFGVAWYGDRDCPGLYRDVLPAWSDENLASLARMTKSRLFMAHVRASTGTATSRSNCHPFTVRNWSFMHNGQIGGYAAIRRRIDSLINDEFFEFRKGTTDSEAIFLLALFYGLEKDPQSALSRAIGTIEDMSRENGCGPFMRASIAVSDGQSLYIVRYASDDFAPSLYMREHSTTGGKLFVSEPLDNDQGCWKALPASSFVTVQNNTVTVSDFRPTILSEAAA